jgi:hypothetical protein
MSDLRRFIPVRAHRGVLPRLVLAGLLLILAACTNGGGGGAGY